MSKNVTIVIEDVDAIAVAASEAQPSGIKRETDPDVVPTTVLLPTELRKALEAMAAREHRSLSMQLVFMIQAALKDQ